MNIKELAQHLDLSIGTVSRALNNKRDVNEKTRKRVLDAAVSLGYSPNASGRSLRRGSTQTIAFMMETGHSTDRPGDNFFMRVIDQMQAALSEANYDLVILPCHSSMDPTNFLKRVIARGMADALVLTATRHDDARIKLLLESHIPFLALGRSKYEDQHPWIDLDFEGFIDEAVGMLHRLGHTRIAATVPPADSNIAYVLREAYEKTHRKLGIPFDPELLMTCELGEAGGAAVTKQILSMDDRPSAVLLNHEMMALGVYAVLAEQNMKAGPDLSVATFRRSHHLRFLDPAVTAFDIDLEALGRALSAETLRLLKNETPQAKMIWPAKLHLTSSIAAPYWMKS